MKKQLWMMAIVTMLAVSAQATIRTVNQFGTAQYLTIQAAINAAATGDTILVAPGTYAETPVITGKALTVIGAGWDLAMVDAGNSSALALGTNSGGSTIEGLDIATGNARAFNVTQLTADSSTIRRCRLRNSSPTVTLDLFSGRRFFLEDCIVTNNGNGTIVSVPTAANSTIVVRGCILGFTGVTQTSAIYFSGNNASPVEITNCTFVSVRQVFNLPGTQPVIAINNIFYDWTGTPSWGTFLAGSVFDYNASDATAPAIPGSFTNQILLGANNPFVTYDEALNYVHGTSDLHLNGGTGGLALTNTGHPSILDIDGSRSDVGAYGGPRPLVDNGVPAYPFVTSLTVPNLIESGDDLNVNSTGRVGPRY